MTEKNFTEYWLKEIRGNLKKFPDQFLEGISSETKLLPGKILVLGPELFGSYEIIDSDGNPVLQTDDFSKAKYFLYASMYRPKELQIPLDHKQINEVVRDYEKHVDGFLQMMEKEFKEKFPESKKFNSISNHIFNSLSLSRY
ncbi:MAG: hypothetical protein M0P71_04020 [Melioribacteraceae bacterium]|nr:hypothetical protein [Melioribacteraceae bacterium]